MTFAPSMGTNSSGLLHEAAVVFDETAIGKSTRNVVFFRGARSAVSARQAAVEELVL